MPSSETVLTPTTNHSWTCLCISLFRDTESTQNMVSTTKVDNTSTGSCPDFDPLVDARQESVLLNDANANTDSETSACVKQMNEIRLRPKDVNSNATSLEKISISPCDKTPSKSPMSCDLPWTPIDKNEAEAHSSVANDNENVLNSLAVTVLSETECVLFVQATTLIILSLPSLSSNCLFNASIVLYLFSNYLCNTLC